MPKVLISTVPFGERNSLPYEMLDSAGIEYEVNKYGRKLTESELEEYISGYDALIAGTEIISSKAIESARSLKVISRVGIGLDGVDLLTAREKNVLVTYTPDAPAPAVAELTIGLIIDLIRGVSLSNYEIHNGIWKRRFGKRISEMTFGIIGLGRIGSRVIRRLSAFGTPRFLVNDIERKPELDREFKLDWVSKEVLFKEADLISLHVPLTKNTINLVDKNLLGLMKNDAFIVNTSRGGVINEPDLYDALLKNEILGAAVDVFCQEPYRGEMSNLRNVILTAHMGSMSEDCRSRMEIEATQEIINYFKGVPAVQPVPDQEYLMREI